MNMSVKPLHWSGFIVPSRLFSGAASRHDSVNSIFLVAFYMYVASLRQEACWLSKWVSNPHGARPVHLIISMIKWIRTSRLSMKSSLSECDLGRVRNIHGPQLFSRVAPPPDVKRKWHI